MTIEFQCPHCDKTLRTAEDKAGWQAKCPGCGQVITVPIRIEVTAGTVEDGNDSHENSSATTASGSSPDDADETRPCPKCGEQIQSAAFRCRFCGENVEPSTTAQRSSGRAREVRPFPPGEAMSEALQIYSERWPLLSGAAIIPVIVDSLAWGTGFFPTTVFPAFMFRGSEEFRFVMSSAIVSLQMLSSFVIFAIKIFLQTGFLILTLKVARKKPAMWSDLFSGGRFWLRMLMNAILYYLVVGLGLCACVVPGVIAAAIFLPFGCILVDEDRPGFDSLWRAKEMTDGNWGSMFLVVIVSYACYVAGTVACQFGLLVAIPYITLLNVVAYERMKRQTSIKSRLDRADFL